MLQRMKKASFLPEVIEDGEMNMPSQVSQTEVREVHYSRGIISENFDGDKIDALLNVLQPLEVVSSCFRDTTENRAVNSFTVVHPNEDVVSHVRRQRRDRSRDPFDVMQQIEDDICHPKEIDEVIAFSEVIQPFEGCFIGDMERNVEECLDTTVIVSPSRDVEVSESNLQEYESDSCRNGCVTLEESNADSIDCYDFLDFVQLTPKSNGHGNSVIEKKGCESLSTSILAIPLGEGLEEENRSKDLDACSAIKSKYGGSLRKRHWSFNFSGSTRLETNTKCERKLKSLNSRITVDQTHRCSDCGRSFAAARNLQKHRASMSSGELFNCQDCDMRFSSPGCLEYHRKVTKLPTSVKNTIEIYSLFKSQ